MKLISSVIHCILFYAFERVIQIKAPYTLSDAQIVPIFIRRVGTPELNVDQGLLHARQCPGLSSNTWGPAHSVAMWIKDHEKEDGMMVVPSILGWGGFQSLRIDRSQTGWGRVEGIRSGRRGRQEDNKFGAGKYPIGYAQKTSFGTDGKGP